MTHDEVARDQAHDAVQASIAAYALGALDPAEREAFAAHLAGCAECRRLTQEQEEVAGLLALAAPPAFTTANDALRERILRAAREHRPISSARSAASASEARASARLTTDPADREHGSGAIAGRVSGARRTGIALFLPWAAAAGVVLAVAAGIIARRATGERDEVAAALAAAQGELAALRDAATSRDSVLVSFLGPRVHVVSLAGADGRTAARVFWNHTKHTFIVAAFDLPRPPVGKTYQLWAMQRGKAPVSMGTFNTDAQGVATTTIAVSDVINGAGVIDDCAVTLEPAGGSPQPTETPRLIGAWRHVD